MSEVPQNKPPKVTFRVVTYWKRKRGEPGLTQMDSKRVALPIALGWVLDELPVDAYTIVFLDTGGNPLPDDVPGTDRVRIDIDWSKVPTEIYDGIS